MIRGLLRGSVTPPFRRRSVFSRASLCLALPLAAFLICELLAPYVQKSADIIFAAAVLLAAWFCGPSLAIGSLGLSTVLLSYFFLRDGNGILPDSAQNWTELILFLGLNGVLLGLVYSLFHTQSELAGSQQMHRNLAELLPFGGWESDSQGNTLRLSQSFLSGFHTSLEQCQGRGWLKLLDEEQRTQVEADWDQCMKHGYFWDYEYRMRATTGRQHVVLSRGVPIRDPRGAVQGWVGIHLDLTDREREAEHRIQQARDLARFDAELEQLAYVSSHDLQEPLRMIASYLQLLSRRYKGRLDSDADQFIGYAVEGAERLRSLLQDLHLLQQIGKGNRPTGPVDLNLIVSKAERELQVQLRAAEALLIYRDLPVVNGSEKELAQLFLNTIDNALKYRKNSVPPVIEIVAERRADLWEISVKDNGIGIEEEYLERIFDVFQRLHPRSDYPGTGIGLSICKKIVEVHGGGIWAESKADVGSTIRFTLPVT